MSFSTRRAAVAAALTAELAGTGTVIHPKIPIPLREGSGWLVLKRADTEETTYAELARVTYDVVVALGTDPQLAEDQLDALAGPIITAAQAVGRGITVSPITLNVDGTDFYCAVGTLITEVES
jgi:hypothetical protein